MPMPPALAKDLAYSSVRNERQTPRAAAAERAFAIDAGEHLAEHRVEEHRLEIVRAARAPWRCIGWRAVAAPIAAERRDAVRGRRRADASDCRHHITSMSAWIAPAALIACRIEIRSRGPMPSALRPSTSCCSDTPSLTTASFLPSSCTPMRVRGTTTVCAARERLRLADLRRLGDA